MLQLEDPLKRNNNNKMYERAKKTRVKQLAKVDDGVTILLELDCTML